MARAAANAIELVRKGHLSACGSPAQAGMQVFSLNEYLGKKPGVTAKGNSPKIVIASQSEAIS